MQKPQSIQRFDMLYLGALAVGTVGFFIGFDNTVAQVNAQYAAAGVNMNGSAMVTGSFIFSMAISLLLWWFISSRRSVVAKWILVVLFALSVLGTVYGFASGTTGMTIATGISLLGTVISAVAVWFLFQPDTGPWFDKEDKR